MKYKLSNLQKNINASILVPIPDWIFAKPIYTADTLIITIDSTISGDALECIDIDTIRRLSGWEKKKVLNTYYDWMRRQKAVDARLLRSQDQRIRRMLEYNKDPEAYTKKMHEFKKRYKDKNKEYRAKKREDKVWVKKQNEKNRKYYLRNKDKLSLKNKKWREKKKLEHPEWIEQNRRKALERYYVKKYRYKDYHSKWYAKNREKILKKRKEEYEMRHKKL